MKGINKKHLIAATIMVALTLLFVDVQALYASVVREKFTKGGTSTADDLHVEFNGGIDSVRVEDANGNPVANPGPFALPPAGLGTNRLDFSGGSPGTVAPGATAPTQPGVGTHKYTFYSGTTPLKITKWWWTIGGIKTAMVQSDCGPDYSLVDAGDGGACVAPGIVPSLTTYGLITLALLLAGTAVWMFRRRRVSVA